MARKYSEQATGLAILVLVVVLGVMISLHHNPFAHEDNSVLSWVVGHRSPPMTSAIAGVTTLFGPAWVLIWTVIAAGIFALVDRGLRRALAVVCTVAGAAVITTVVKAIVDRPRPPLVDQAAGFESSQSFPSGHVTGTAALVLAIALVATVGAPRIWRVLALTLAATVAVFAALTRVYLGVHWASDVVAALAVASAAAMLIPPATAALLDILGPHLPQRLQPYLLGAPSPHQRESQRALVAPQR